MPRLTKLIRAALATWAVVLVASVAVSASSRWMTEEAIRAALIGRTLDGHYSNGVAWTETYSAEGRLSYREQARRGEGTWSLRGHVFCTFYDPGPAAPPLSGGCWTVIQAGPNCYEFYLASALREGLGDEEADGPLRAWEARGWRRGETSTCEVKPSV